MIRFAGIVLGLGALVVLPYTLSVLVLFVLAFFTPLAGVSLGVILDALYFTKGVASFPYASLIGLIATVVGFGVQRFIHTHVSTR